LCEVRIVCQAVAGSDNSTAGGSGEVIVCGGDVGMGYGLAAASLDMAL
jgi:hypothetical protein